jgi:DNA-binding response OmpR family regulator
MGRLVVTEAESRVVRLGNLIVDMNTYRVRVGEEFVALGLHEFDALAILAQRPDHLVTYEELMVALWGASGHQYSRRLAVLIFRLRAKLQKSTPYVIESVRGRGYGLMTSIEESIARGTERNQSA